MEGFVESIPRKGTIVRPIRQEDLSGQLMLREAVECQAARLFCGLPVRDNRAELDAIAEELEMTASDAPEHWKQEIRFHGFLVGLSGVPTLVHEFMRIIRLGSFFRLNRILTKSDKAERLSHFDLLEALSRDDPDNAEKAIRAHLRSGKHHVILS
jgi:DNA-binding GntR family transcriptional regulator